MIDSKHSDSAFSNQKSDCPFFERNAPEPLVSLASALNAPINGLGVSSVHGLVAFYGMGGGCYTVDGFTVRVTKGVLLAKKPLKLSKTLFFTLTDSKVVNEFYDMFFDRFMKFIENRTGKKPRRGSARMAMFKNVFLHLVNCYYSGSQLLYKRGHHDSEWRNILEVSEFMSHEGVVVNIIGKNNTTQKNASWMIPTPSFGALVEMAKIRLLLKNDDSLVILRDKKRKGEKVGREKSLPRIGHKNWLILKSISNLVQDYCSIWEGLSEDEIYPTLDGAIISPFCTRIFNLLNDFSLGGRWYGVFQNISKDDRRRILIGGESTVEPDWRSMHFAILYAQEGIQLQSDDDPYSLEGFDKSDRKWIKSAMLQLINCDSESIFINKVNQSSNPKIKKIYSDYQRKRAQYEKDRLQGKKCKEPSKHDSLEGFIPSLPDGIKGEDLLAVIKKRHPKIAHRFCTKHLGLHLQNFDSAIMSRVIQQLVAFKIPHLPIHDSVRCRESDIEEVVEAMKKAYRMVTKERTGTGFDCVIDY
jgi:hypothetical protein